MQRTASSGLATLAGAVPCCWPNATTAVVLLAPPGTRTAYVGVVTRLSVRLIRPPFFNKAEVEG